MSGAAPSRPASGPFGAPPVLPGQVDPLAPELTSDPYEGYGRLREQAPLLRGRYLDGTAVWYVTRQSDVRKVLADTRFANDPSAVSGAEDRRTAVSKAMGVPPEYVRYVVGTIVDSDSPDHTRLRRLVSRAFTARRVPALRPRVEEITAALLDDVGRAGDPVDLLETYAYPLPITVIGELVGIDEDDRAAWRASGRALVTMERERFGPALRDLVERVHALIRRRRVTPRDAA